MRKEFSLKTRRAAFERAAGFCEAVGAPYGLPRGKRCNAPLSKAVEFDHFPVRACDGGDNSLDNCVAVCPVCHRWKTRKIDMPSVAKGKRIRDRHRGLLKPGTKFPTNRNGRFKKKLDGEVVIRDSSLRAVSRDTDR